MADLVNCPNCGTNLPLAVAACPRCGLIFDKWHGPHPSGTAAVPSVPPALPSTVKSPGPRDAANPESGNGRRLNLRLVVLTLAVCVALFVAGRWSASSPRPTIVRPATAPSAASPAGIPASADVQPTGEIRADLASIDAEIRRVEEEDAKYSGGLVKALIGSELHIYRQTRAMLQQRARSWLFGIGLSFTVDGKPLVLPANAPEQLAAVEQEITETRAKVAEAEAEAARYSGGLVQAMSLASAATVRNTLAMLEQRRLALKYSLPQYIGFQRDDTSASPRSVSSAPVAVLPKPEEKPWKIIQIDSRVTESNDVWWRYAWKLTIRNDAETDGSFDATIEFQDSDGFVIDSARESHLAVPARSERTFTGYSLVSVPGATRVARTNAKVAPR